MSMDKNLRRLEAKLDALLEDAGLDPAEFGETQEGKEAARPPRELTAAEQQAVDNAPATPAATPPERKGPRVTQENAPDTSSSVPKEAAGGKLQAAGTEADSPASSQQPTASSQQDGDTKVETKPASQAKEGETGKRKS